MRVQPRSAARILRSTSRTASSGGKTSKSRIRTGALLFLIDLVRRTSTFRGKPAQRKIRFIPRLVRASSQRLFHTYASNLARRGDPWEVLLL